MTVNEVFKKAVALLGYSNADGSESGLEVLHSRNATAVNQILADLGEQGTLVDTDKIPLSNNGLEVLIYGTAMLLALSISDNEKSNLFTNLYNLKRSSYKSHITKRSDTLPNLNGGVMG